MLAGCSLGGSNGAANHPSPVVSTAPVTSVPASASASSAPPPAIGAYGVLYSSQAASSYTVSIVDVDGKVVASATASTPPITSCANAAGAPVPAPLSMSDSLAYYMNADGIIWSLGLGGPVGRVTAVPANSASQRSMFAVSPDDKRIAVVVVNYNATGASTRLYVEDLAGSTNHIDIFSETGASTLWPVGWHGTNNLVLAKVVSCTQGGGPFCCGVQELHVVDPATATRRFTLGSTTSCPIVGAASPAGVVCWDGTNSRVLNWTAGVVRTYPVQGPELQLLSPSGSHIALVDNTATVIQDTGKSLPNMFACTWVDDSHVLSGGDPQHQPRIADVTTGTMVPVPTQGDCAGRLPGGL